MMKEKKARPFDCVQMKRRIQERIYAETRNMGPDELLEYFRRRIAASRFASIIGDSSGTG
jgi:hypothetical protein